MGYLNIQKYPDYNGPDLFSGCLSKKIKVNHQHLAQSHGPRKFENALILYKKYLYNANEV